MQVEKTALDGVLIIDPQVHGDKRGFFMESWKASSYQQAGLPPRLAQSNYSRSSHGVLRGLHFQQPSPQGKLVSVVDGSIFDVAVDIRRGSETFAQWVGVELSAEDHRQLYVPEGFAHGFCVTSETALVHYMCSREFVADFDRAIAWNDPQIGIEWPLEPSAVSVKDAAAPTLSEIDPLQLPEYLS